MVDFESKTRPH